MAKEHRYSLTVKWKGNTGQGTTSYTGYKRDHTVIADGKAELECSSDAAFRGDKSKYSPEELLVASLAGCHMLWFLHLCAEAGVVVTDYRDGAKGTLTETADGGGSFTLVTLYPFVTVSEKYMIEKANELHKKANELCFIARSVNFPVHHSATAIVQNLHH